MQKVKTEKFWEFWEKFGELWLCQNVQLVTVKKFKFIKKPEATGLLSRLWIKPSWSKILLVVVLLF